MPAHVDAIWTVAPLHNRLDQVASSLNLHRGAAQVLLNRGGEAAATSEHLHPQLKHLVDPAALTDIDRGVTLLIAALKHKTPICIYGDYDVDGTTSTAIMVEALRQLGGEVGYYLPHRLVQGYGLHRDAVDTIHQQGFRVLVTADLGVTNVEEVEYAKALGMTVIITDHHQVTRSLPIADAVINPHRPNDLFPYKGLCAAGVCFHLLIALRRALRGQGFPELDLRPLLDLVALATVADMVPLTGVNRILVSRGLDVLREGRRPGLVALARVAGIEPERIDARDLGFRLGPRVNAAGRMGSAMRCVELFLSDGLVAADLASRLDKENHTRREVEDEVLQQAMQQAEARYKDPGLVVFDPYWHPGVVGIVASRLVEKFHRPVVVIGKDGKGSARSVPGVHILEAIRAGAEALHKFGGHEFAAGVTLKDGQDQVFRSGFCAGVLAQQNGQAYKPELKIDCELTASDINTELVRDLERVGPFGTGHPEPLFVWREASVLGRKVVGQNHLKLGLAGGLSAIGFRMAQHPDSEASKVDVVFTPNVSEWNGTRKVELQIKAMRTAQSLSPLAIDR